MHVTDTTWHMLTVTYQWFGCRSLRCPWKDSQWINCIFSIMFILSFSCLQNLCWMNNAVPWGAQIKSKKAENYFCCINIDRTMTHVTWCKACLLMEIFVHNHKLSDTISIIKKEKKKKRPTCLCLQLLGSLTFFNLTKYLQ